VVDWQPPESRLQRRVVSELIPAAMGVGGRPLHPWIDPIRPHQVKRRLGLTDGVIEWIGEDLGPTQPGFHA